VLIENLRRTAAPRGGRARARLYERFDGLDELSRIEYYRHPANWSNRMVLGDSLQVMASMAERRLRGKVQMILHRPRRTAIKFGSNWQVRVDKRDVKDGRSKTAPARPSRSRPSATPGTRFTRILVPARPPHHGADLLPRAASCFVQIGDENVTSYVH